MMQWRRIF